MKNKHQLQSEKTYQAFIDAIMEIIAKGDIEKFTIRSLCSSLGLSPRTFYLYFKNKDHAILQCYSCLLYTSLRQGYAWYHICP